jgi:hypothetical protein
LEHLQTVGLEVVVFSKITRVMDRMKKMLVDIVEVDG